MKRMHRFIRVILVILIFFAKTADKANAENLASYLCLSSDVKTFKMQGDKLVIKLRNRKCPLMCKVNGKWYDTEQTKLAYKVSEKTKWRMNKWKSSYKDIKYNLKMDYEMNDVDNAAALLVQWNGKYIVKVWYTYEFG